MIISIGNMYYSRRGVGEPAGVAAATLGTRATGGYPLDMQPYSCIFFRYPDGCVSLDRSANA